MWRTPRAPRTAQGAASNDKKPHCCQDEPGDHGLGRSRGGLSTKIHAAVDGRGRPLAILLTPGQSGDAPMMLAPARCDPGRAAPRPATDPPGAGSGRQGLFVAGDPRPPTRTRHRHRDPGTQHPDPEPQPPRLSRRATRQLRQDRLQSQKRRRTRLQHHQTLARPGHPLRQTRHHLPRRSVPLGAAVRGGGRVVFLGHFRAVADLGDQLLLRVLGDGRRDCHRNIRPYSPGSRR
jgi:hypothetical protein